MVFPCISMFLLDFFRVVMQFYLHSASTNVALTCIMQVVLYIFL
jgi:hypothetical protein